MASFGKGQAFRIEEHDVIRLWEAEGRGLGVRLELAMNYPDTPEMYGIIEDTFLTPTLFLWRRPSSVVLSAFSGSPTQEYDNIEAALSALSDWARRTVDGSRVALRGQRDRDTP